MKYTLLSAAFALFAVTAVAEAGAPVSPAAVPAMAVDGANRAIQVDYRCPRGTVRTPSGRCIRDRRWRSDRRHGWDRHSPRYYRERERNRRWRHAHRDRHRHYVEPRRRRGPHD
ncbi:hypothetical protein H7Q97_08355 [Ochrobactrum sp. CM-21-5]|nr:hypothetical protein [Ochrobactrum sp. CM-21-5]MBC2885417.1 hypothetical protein [Ochrobactrum sp. CM-21-5]